MRYLKKDYFYVRLTELRKKLMLTDGTCMTSDKKLINLIFRGFSNSQINDLVREQFYYWDVPRYWKEEMSLRTREYSVKSYIPKYKHIFMEIINE